MLLPCQKELFALEAGVHYFNGAAYSPGLRSALEKGIEGLTRKAARPFTIRSTDHFEQADRVRQQFSDLIQAGDPARVAFMPAVSYGLAVVAANLHRLPGIESKKRILMVQEEFPNDVYAFERVCANLQLELYTVDNPGRGHGWSERVLETITPDTALVVMPQVHWIYGVAFDLVAIGARCREMGALLVIDGTQSIGAYPFDTQAIQPDAVICAGYKWLLGPYGISAGYFGPFFDDGVPVEENWANRVESDQFAQLTRYLRDYRPKAQRYNMGEFAAFGQLPVLEASLAQLNAWGPVNIQDYCNNLMREALPLLEARGCRFEPEATRAAHLFGVVMPEGIDRAKLLEKMASRNVYASLRGQALRLSVNVYNDGEDVAALMDCLGGF